MNSDSWCFQKRISTIIFYLLYLLCSRTHLCCETNQPSCCILKKVRHSAGVWRVLSPPPPPLPLSFSLSLSLSTFTFQFSHRFSYCLSSSVGMVSCLKLLSYFLSLHVDPSLSPRKKNWSGILFSLLTYSLSRDVHMHRKNDQRHIYSSNLKFFFMRFSQPGHLRGCCHISPNVSLPLPPGIS